MPPGLRHTFALTVAAAFGLGGIIENRPRRGPDPVEALDQTLASLRPALPAGARVGYLFRQKPWASADETERWYVVQYALAPSVVRPIVVSECMARGPEACGAADIGFLVVEGARPDEAFLERLGFSPTAKANGFALLARRLP